MSPDEKICPVCKYSNEQNAVVCKHCGASLSSSKYASQTPKDPDVTVFYAEKQEEFHVEEPIIPGDGITVYYAGKNEPIAIRTEDEFIIGRQTGDASESILDLSEFDGFQMGMSRRHAKIRRTQTGYEVIDLGTTNGTWMDDKRLVPNKPYPLANGSMLRLGRIRLLVFYLSETENKSV